MAFKNIKPMRTGVKITKSQRAAIKAQRAIARANTNTRVAQAKTTAQQAMAKGNSAKLQADLNSSNPITRKLAQWKDTSIKKHDVKIRKLESDAQMAETNPKIRMEQVRADNRVKIESAKVKGKAASYSALAAGAAQLGRGLSDESNQDDSAEREQQRQVISKIFGSNTDGGTSDDTGLSKGVE